jgi:hypothetical protein
LAVPRRVNPDVTNLLRWVWTNVYILPSGAMNKSARKVSPPEIKVLVPVQFALTVYVPPLSSSF